MSTPTPEPSPVLATGAWLKNTACLLGPAGQVRWSAAHGDLGTPEACAALRESVQALLRQAPAVRAVAHDLHPDFFSTHLAVEIAATLGVPAIGVQHHHAHIAAVVAEHGITAPVVGLALDGVGLGTDGQAWGGELLWVDGARWQRLGHLRPLALPGGDRAAREPWRMAASALHALGRGAEITPRFAPVVGESLARGVQQMLDSGLRCPATTSTGRWFDAAAAALGLCLHQQEEAQAAIALEQAATRALQARADLPPLPGVRWNADGRPLDLRPLLAALFDAVDVGVAAAGFHLALADALAEGLVDAARRHGTRHAVLAGGCFFNRILRERVSTRATAAGLQVHLPVAQGCGDAGLALGQAWVAAQQLASIPPIPVHEEALPCA
ncbi:MAG: carbamoyltransferase HypF [Hydrogenophaga sp.]|nr:carbamoyltransferase HypF [Hydrogenophaga sp.]MCW5654893.1 carbamoyltransferase HypF [Hydrogenophaga sp.]